MNIAEITTVSGNTFYLFPEDIPNFNSAWVDNPDVESYIDGQPLASLIRVRNESVTPFTRTKILKTNIEQVTTIEV